jgi:hypothetical protein
MSRDFTSFIQALDRKEILSRLSKHWDKRGYYMIYPNSGMSGDITFFIQALE